MASLLLNGEFKNYLEEDRDVASLRDLQCASRVHGW